MSTYLARLLAIGLLALAPCGDATAATLVFNNGARVEVREDYRLNGENLEYVDAAGRKRSVSFDDVDLARTAAANGMSKAAFVWRASAGTGAGAVAVDAPIVVTDATLEPIRQERLAWEAAHRAERPASNAASEQYTAAAPPPRDRDPVKYDYDSRRSRGHGYYETDDDYVDEATYVGFDLRPERYYGARLRGDYYCGPYTRRLYAYPRTHGYYSWGYYGARVYQGATARRVFGNRHWGGHCSQGPRVVRGYRHRW
jgi:hypothetical protein